MPDDNSSATLANHQAVRTGDSHRRRELEPLTARCQRAAWNRGSATQFVNHLLKTHHPHLEERLKRVEKSFVAVAAKHGLAHGNTWRLANIFVELADKMQEALDCEHLLLGAPPSETEGLAAPCWRSRQELFVAASGQGSQDIDALFREIRLITSDDGVVADRCVSYRAMLDEIAMLERDYLTHIRERTEHLESLAAD